MKSIYIDTYQLHSNSSNIGTFVSPEGLEGFGFADIRMDNYELSGEHGARIGGLLYGGRLLTLSGVVFSNTLAAYETKRRTFEKNLRIRLGDNNKPIARTLYMTTMDDLALQTEVYIRKLKFDPYRMNFARFQLELFAPFFAFESQSLQSEVVPRAGGGGATYPVTYPVDYGAVSGGTGNITNGGTAEAYPIFTFNGPLTNPILRNTTTGKDMKLNMTLADGVIVVVDTKNKTILQAGVTNRISKKDTASEWWTVEPGTNYITLDTSDTSDTGNVEVSFRDTFLGI